MQQRGLTLALLGAMLLFAGSLSAQEGAIKYRQAIMKAVSGHAGAVAQIAYGGVAHTDHLKGHAHALHEVTLLVATTFREKALAEDPPTIAKPEIWQNWGEFEDKVAALVKAAADVAAAAESGGAGAVAGVLDPLWESCKGCHKAFRKKAE